MENSWEKHLLLPAPLARAHARMCEEMALDQVACFFYTGRRKGVLSSLSHTVFSPTLEFK